MLNNKAHHILYGGDYNPDQWDEAIFQEDMILFEKAGINCVTLPVFSWAKIETEEGVYHFEWLDHILDTLWEHRISVILATPTAAQPAWLSLKYPDVLPVDVSGRKRTHGMRVFFCVNSPSYRKRAALMAQRMAERYASHPALLAWHVANEYGTYCYCDTCQAAFRIWLKERYGSVEELNLRWHTSFWGRTLTSFDEIFLPTELNDDYRFYPAVQLDYQRFVTDSTLDCYENEARILRAASPDLPVFSNISGFIKKLDQFKLVGAMSCAAWDNYPRPGDDPSFVAMKLDLMRGLKGGESFLIAEQSPNQQNWQPYNRLKRPGEVRLIAYQGLARGGDSCLFYQMRQSIGGQEKFHGALISHSGSSDTRIFKELAALGEELKRLGGRFVGARTEAKVAILFDWDAWWALELSSGPSKDLDYLWGVACHHAPFYRRNIAVDMVPVDASLDSYQVVVAPLLYMMKDGVAERITSFVSAGGTLITTYMSSLVDKNDRCSFGAYPGPLSEVLGIWVEETDALSPGEENEVAVVTATSDSKVRETPFAGTYRCSFLCDLINLRGAKAVATYTKDFYRDRPCVTVNDFGHGRAWYLGARLEDRFLDQLAEHLEAELSLSPPIAAPRGVEVALRTRTSEGEIRQDSYFVLNHLEKDAELDLRGQRFRNLLDDRVFQGHATIGARDVVVLERINSKC